jgi:hypothetical protein
MGTPKTPSARSSRAAARNTDSAPSYAETPPDDDLPAQRMVQTQRPAAAMPANTKKALEHGERNALSPHVA